MLSFISEVNPAKEIAHCIAALNLDIQKLNRLIASYNEPEEDQASYLILVQIVNHLNQMQDKYKPIDLERSAFKRSRDELSNALQTEFSEYHLVDNREQQVNYLASLITDAPQKQIKQLFSNLLMGKSSDEILGMTIQFVEARDKSLFFNATRNCSHGTALDPEMKEPPLSLRVDEMDACSSTTLVSLQNSSFNKYLVPVSGQRQQLIKKEDKLTLQTLSISPSFLRLLDSHSSEKETKHPIIKALIIYIQMAKILINLAEQRNSQGESYIFPNMQNSSWGYCNYELLITDASSIVFCDEDDLLNLSSKHIFAEGFQPPEAHNPKVAVSAAPIHAYILGKNLYQFLTQKQPGKELDFKQPIFQNKAGRVMQTLIQGLVQEEPQRLSVANALKVMEDLDRRLKSTVLLKEIRTYAIKKTGLRGDKLMNAFYTEKKAALAAQEADLGAMHHELDVILEGQKDTARLLKNIDKASNSLSIFARGKRKNLGDIKEELLNTPIEERSAKSIEYLNNGLKLVESKVNTSLLTRMPSNS